MSEQGKFLLYTAKDGAVKVEVFFRDETVWLTQKALAELFGVKRPAITKHLGNIFETGELAEDSVMFHFGTYCRGRENLRHQVLQPRCHHRRRLPGEQLPGHAVPHLGDEDAAGVHHQGLRAG